MDLQAWCDANGMAPNDEAHTPRTWVVVAGNVFGEVVGVGPSKRVAVETARRVLPDGTPVWLWPVTECEPRVAEARRAVRDLAH